MLILMKNKKSWNKNLEINSYNFEIDKIKIKMKLRLNDSIYQ